MGIQMTGRGRGALFLATGLLLGAAVTLAADTPASAPPAPAAQASADSAAEAGEKAERCIQIRSIKQTKVVDDQTIIFYTAGNRNYKNRLPYTCGGLAIADSFMYRTSVSQLCSVDIITVLNRMGSNFAPGPSCGLGLFEQIDARQLDELTSRPARKR